MGTIARDPSNTRNFLTWKKTIGVVTGDLSAALAITAADPITNLPNNYKRHNLEYKPSILRAATFNHYINFTTALTDTDFTTWRIRMFQADGALVDPVSLVLKQHTIGNDWRMSIEGSIDAGISAGIYRFELHSTSGLAVKYVSNCFNLITDASAMIKLEYRNSSDLWYFGYRYGFSLYNTIWIDANVVKSDLELKLDQYSEGSTGKKRNEYTQANQMVTIETQQFDERAHLAMKAVSQHDDIKLNTKIYTVKKAYEISDNKSSNLQNGKIVLYDEEYSTVNLNG